MCALEYCDKIVFILDYVTSFLCTAEIDTMHTLNNILSKATHYCSENYKKPRKVTIHKIFLSIINQSAIVN